MKFFKQKVNDCVQHIILQNLTNSHAIRSWSFGNICNEVGWPVAPFFCATLYIVKSSDLTLLRSVTQVLTPSELMNCTRVDARLSAADQPSCDEFSSNADIEPAYLFPPRNCYYTNLWSLLRSVNRTRITIIRDIPGENSGTDRACEIAHRK